MRDFEVADRSKERVLLASPIGLKYKFLPVGIAILKSYLSKRSTFQVDTLSLCVTFSEYLARNHPSLTIYDTQMGEWGSSFHELYFATKYFKHADPRHLLGETLADYLRKQDIFQVGPWEAVETYSEEIHQIHTDRVLEYCRLSESYSLERLRQELEESPPFVLGFSCTAQQVFNAAYLARFAKRYVPELTVVLGGPAMMGRTAHRYLELFPEVDVVVWGDGEEALLAIVNSLYKYGRIPSLPGVFHRGEHQVMTVPTKSPELNDVDPPDYDEIQEEIINRSYPLTTWISRGCSWGKCSFCSIPEYQRNYFTRSAERVYQEIAYLHEKYGMNRFIFGDWEVNGSPRTLKDLCQLIIQGERDFEFWGEVNARKMTKDLMALMKQAGFVSVQVGLEAFSNSLLRKMNKPTTKLENIKCLIYAHETGMEMFSNILYNFPFEEEREIMENERVLHAISHLIKPPVSLALAEFLLEIDADIHSTLSEERLQKPGYYRFESRCFPEESRGVYFLEHWDRPVHPRWYSIQNLIEEYRRFKKTFSHEQQGDTIVLRDDRFHSPATMKLKGVEARIYRSLLGRVVHLAQLRRSLSEELSEEELEHHLMNFERKKFILRSGNHLLALSVDALAAGASCDEYTRFGVTGKSE